MDKDKRKNSKPVPDDLESLLNAAQLKALLGIKPFGWTLEFVRQPMFQDPVPVVINVDSDTYGVLEKDGKVNVDVPVELRAKIVKTIKRYGS